MSENPGEEPKAPKVKAPKTLRVRASKEYLNGMIPSGVPWWKPGEIREVSLADFKAMQEDAPGNFEVLDVE